MIKHKNIEIIVTSSEIVIRDGRGLFIYIKPFGSVEWGMAWNKSFDFIYNWQPDRIRIVR